MSRKKRKMWRWMRLSQQRTYCILWFCITCYVSTVSLLFFFLFIACSHFLCAYFNFCEFNFIFRDICTRAYTYQQKKRHEKQRKKLIYQYIKAKKKQKHHHYHHQQPKEKKIQNSSAITFEFIYLFNLIVANCIATEYNKNLRNFFTLCVPILCRNFYCDVILHNKRKRISTFSANSVGSYKDEHTHTHTQQHRAQST